MREGKSDTETERERERERERRRSAKIECLESPGK